MILLLDWEVELLKKLFLDLVGPVVYAILSFFILVNELLQLLF